MAAIISTAIGELASAIEAGGIRGLLLRGGVIGAGSFGVSELLNFLQGRTSSGDSAKDEMLKHKLPRYALVDLKKDTVLVYMGPRRAYRILLRPRRRATRTKIIREVVREK